MCACVEQGGVSAASVTVTPLRFMLLVRGLNWQLAYHNPTSSSGLPVVIYSIPPSTPKHRLLVFTVHVRIEAVHTGSRLECKPCGLLWTCMTTLHTDHRPEGFILHMLSPSDCLNQYYYNFFTVTLENN